MGRRRVELSTGGIQFVSHHIGSLVTLGSSSTSETDKLKSPEVGNGKAMGDHHVWSQRVDQDKGTKAQIQRLDFLWDKNKKLVDDSQRLMLDLQALPAPATPEEAVEASSIATTLKEVLEDPIPVVLEAWEQRPSFLKFGDTIGTGDSTITESLANVATSAPFLYIGLNTPRKRPYDRLYARSLMGVGIASSMYHTSRGETRPFFRWCDYAMIGASSMCLSKALNPDMKNRWLLLSASLLPFQPMLVTALNTAAMEVKFARRSLAEPERYQKAHRLHGASTLLGGICFLAEEVYPDVPFVHAAWHIAAALAIHTSNVLLN